MMQASKWRSEDMIAGMFFSAALAMIFTQVAGVVANIIDGIVTSRYRRINDVHPMPYLRINCTLQQFDEFLNYYGITEGDGMYLAPADRVIIW